MLARDQYELLDFGAGRKLERFGRYLIDRPCPAAADDVRTRIRRYADEANVGILWTSHNMYEVEDVCHRVLFLSHGRILLEGDPKRLPIEHGHKTLEDLFIAVAREPLTLGAK